METLIYIAAHFLNLFAGFCSQSAASNTVGLHLGGYTLMQVTVLSVPRPITGLVPDMSTSVLRLLRM